MTGSENLEKGFTAYSVQKEADNFHDSVGKKTTKACSGAVLRMIAATACIAGAVITCMCNCLAMHEHHPLSKLMVNQKTPKTVANHL